MTALQRLYEMATAFINGDRSDMNITKARGFGLCVGLNAVDPEAYGGWDGQLAGCEADAKAMASLLKARGFLTTTLLTARATAAEVLGNLDLLSQKALAGDLVVFSNSSHGGQIVDENGDEADDLDETLCAYDREIIDDEIYAAFTAFSPGVRVFFLSDSCHSGTAMRAFGPEHPLAERTGQRTRNMPREVALRTYAANKPMYDAILKDPNVREGRGKIVAEVVSLSGCADNQTSMDGDKNGLFTEHVLKQWGKGAFTGTMNQFAARVRAGMPSYQQPYYFTISKNDAALKAFCAQTPFTI